MRFLVAIVAALLAVSAQANPVPFEQWLRQFKAEAAQQGIAQPLLEQAFRGVAPNETIIRLDRKQPEGRIGLDQYLRNTVNDQRIREGRRLLAENRALLEEVGARYGVQPRFIVALWGIETSYGKVTGGFGIIGALATLAYDGRRSDFFRKELLDALRILQEGHIDLPRFKGSWAGAMGQAQFMPSTFFKYAEDFRGDGHKNLWTDKADVFASAANYLHQIGWNPDLTWGREVRLPAGFDTAQAEAKLKRSLPEWAALGVVSLSGTPLPEKPEISAWISLPDGPGGRAFVVYSNFDCLLDWNKSRFFATAVGKLADGIGG